MLEVLGRRLAESDAHREELAFRGVPALIAATLLRLAQGHPGSSHPKPAARLPS